MARLFLPLPVYWVRISGWSPSLISSSWKVKIIGSSFSRRILERLASSMSVEEEYFFSSGRASLPALMSSFWAASRRFQLLCPNSFTSLSRWSFSGAGFCCAGAGFSCPDEDVNRAAKKSSERVNRGAGSRILDMLIGFANGLLNATSCPLYPENAMESKREGSINAEKPTESSSWVPIYSI